ncbi:MAG: glycosyltransferase family 2 protein [Gemmatimonadetes bacterium]|nr:glycosyltransferase family 2 protein [Gemmatimonadota bacterium]
MIYICIPALDEAPTVGVLLWKVRQVMAEFGRDFHLIVLDDGSTDPTQEVVEPYARVLPLTVLRNERTLGYPAAVERLLREAVARSTHPKRDVAVVLQGDFTESPDDIPALVRKVEGGADVVGTVVAGTDRELPRAERWARRGLPWLLSGRALPREIRDPLSGFRAYRVAVLKRALAASEGKPLLSRPGLAANVELLVAVAPHVRRADAAEVSLRYARRERDTRFRPWGTVVEVWNLARRTPRRGPAPVEAETPKAPPAEGARPARRGPRGTNEAGATKQE